VIVNVSSGTLTVNNNINFSVTNNLVRRQLNVGENGTLILNGNFSGVGEHTFHPLSTVRFVGAQAQNIMAADYGNLELSGGGAKTSTGNTIVSGNLALNSSNLNMNHNLNVQGSVNLGGVIFLSGVDFTLGSNSTITGTFGVGAHINLRATSRLIKFSNSASGFLATYPLGNSQGYTPINLTELTATLSGGNNSRSIEFGSIDTRHPLATGAGNTLNTFWRLRSVNITNITRFAFSANYADAAIPPGVNEADLNTIARLMPGGWTLNPTGSSINAANNQLSFDTSNVVISGDYTIGELTAFPPVIDQVFSVATGNWSSASTWSSNSVPGITSNVYVLHRVNAGTINGVNNLTIGTTGTLISDQNSVNINGNFDIFGSWVDQHSSGQNIIGGKFTVHQGGTALFPGSGGNTLYTEFRGDVEVNGAVNTNGQFVFSANNNNRIKVTGSSSITMGGSIVSNVDSLILENAGGITTNDSVRLGNFNLTRNVVLLNNTRLEVARSIIGRPNGNFQRKLVQGANGHLVVRNNIPFIVPTLSFDFATPGNTVEYGGGINQAILNTNYHHVLITGDRSDRLKILDGNSDVLIGGNLTVQSNGAVFQCGQGLNGRTVRINGNVEFNGNGRIGLANQGTKVNLIIGGKLINNHNSNLGFRQNDSTYFNVNFTGSGVIAEGSGDMSVRHLRLSGSDTIIWNNTGQVSIFDSLSTSGSALLASNSYFFIPLSRNVTFAGTSTLNKLGSLQLTDRADRSVQFFQRMPLEIDSVLQLTSSGQNQPALYDFAGQTLIINNNLTISTTGQNGANSILRPDTNSTLIIRGTGTIQNLSFAPNFRNIGYLEIDRSNGVTFASGSGLRVYRELRMLQGNITTNARLSMHQGSTVIRKKGKLIGTFQNTTSPYHVVYTDSVITGNEATGVATIKSIKVAAGAGNVVAFGNSPSVDEGLMFESGNMVALANNYVRLAGNATAKVNRVIPTTLFPVGLPAGRGFFELKVNNEPSGELAIRPVLAPHPRRASAPSYLRKYVTLDGTATAVNVDMSLLYDQPDVFGTEANLATSFYNGTAWTTANGTIDIDLNKATMTGITSFGDLTAGANMGDSTVANRNKLVVNGFTLHPNPGQDELFIALQEQSLANATMIIADISGKTVLTTSLPQAGQSINTSTLKPGVYHIKVISAKGERLMQTPWVKQ
jgi:hypothetical protein